MEIMKIVHKSQLSQFFTNLKCQCLAAAMVLSFAAFGGSQCSVDLLAGKALSDFECLLTDDAEAISRAYSLSEGVMRVSGEVRAILVTKETYGDFDLSFDINYPEPGFGDGGVMLWVKMLPDRPDIHTGMEIQTKTGCLGDLWGLSRFVLSRDAATPPPEGHIDSLTEERYRCIQRLVDVQVSTAQWHHVDFRRHGRDCELLIDGKLVNRCTIAADPGEGRIGFQTRPYEEGKVPILYRNMILTPHETDAVNTPTDLYLLIGQSNMAGRGITNAANRLSSERVLKFTKDRKWAEGVEPIHFDRPFTGAGPGLAFARSMADADGHAVIGLIPCADGGTPLSRWEPGHDLYANAVSRTKAALASGGRLRGILWHQGEADSWAKETAETYAVRLTNMVTQLRRDLDATDVPFIAGEVGAHYAVSLEKRGKKPYVKEVNAQMKKAVGSLPVASWVSADGLEPGQDGIHFTTESAYELGRRYAREMLRMKNACGACDGGDRP